MTAVLAYDLHAPEGARDGTPVVVLLHGRGSHRGDLQALADHLPAAMPLVTPQAPHPGHAWGYGPGWAWYRYVAEDRLVPETLDESLEALGGFLDELENVLPVRPGPVVLGGFSQGGTTSLSFALRHPGRVTGVLNFSGFLPAAGIVELDDAPRTPVFWGHGRRDPSIPFALAGKGRRRLEEAGAPLTTGDYDIGHWIDPAEMRDAVAWMEGVLGEGEG